VIESGFADAAATWRWGPHVSPSLLSSPLPLFYLHRLQLPHAGGGIPTATEHAAGPRRARGGIGLRRRRPGPANRCDSGDEPLVLVLRWAAWPFGLAWPVRVRPARVAAATMAGGRRRWIRLGRIHSRCVCGGDAAKPQPWPADRSLPGL
jgi:hypothetical protein